MSFKDGLHKRKEIIDQHLNTYLKVHNNKFEEHLHESMLYSLLSGGKRIRPILMMEIGRMYNVDEKELIDFACAIEMIHTYSLIHDDLPAMDDDDLRRGKKTNHIVYGDAMAILAGDGLLNLAYETMADVCCRYGIEHAKAMRVISKAAGHTGMVGGQVADMLSEVQGGDASILRYIQENKTSALLTCPLVAGGYIAKLDEATINVLQQLGTCIGISFQIKDDILDIESDEATLGKPIGSDEKNNKLTYPGLFGIDASKNKVKELTNEAYQLIDKLEGDVSFLRSLIDYLCIRDS